MNLVYNQEKIPVTITKNKNIMRYKFPKLYYAIIIEDCNRYSSIASKQRVDIVMTDNDLKILSYKKEMHENTVYENKIATKTILLPLTSFLNLQLEQKFELENTKTNIKKF